MRVLAFLGLTAAAALPATNAWAFHDFSELFDAGYAYRDIGAATPAHGDQYSVHFAGLFSLDDPGFNVQVNGGDDWLAEGRRVDQQWTAGANIFWRDRKGTFGISGSFASMDGPALPFFQKKAGTETLGLFGEYYVLKDLTLEIKGGGSTGGIPWASYFGGGGVTFYLLPDLALHSDASMTAFIAGRDWTNVRAEVEYLPYEPVPVSVYAGYDYTIVSTLGHANTFMLGFKVHFGHGQTLVEDQRTGPIEWTADAAPSAGLRF